VQVLHAVGKDVRIEAGEGGTTVTFRLPVPTAASRLPRIAAPAGPARTAVARVTGEPPLLRVSGDLDLDGVAAVRAVLLDALGPGELAVDLHDVRYVSSAGVAMLVELTARARARGASLVLQVSAESPVARLLELTGLRSALPVVVR
jgi:anti-anti-sigma factor